MPTQAGISSCSPPPSAPNRPHLTRTHMLRGCQTRYRLACTKTPCVSGRGPRRAVRPPSRSFLQHAITPPAPLGNYFQSLPFQAFVAVLLEMLKLVFISCTQQLWKSRRGCIDVLSNLQQYLTFETAHKARSGTCVHLGKHNIVAGHTLFGIRGPCLLSVSSHRVDANHMVSLFELLE